jgi:type VI secretion system secreted protein Hcp
MKRFLLPLVLGLAVLAGPAAAANDMFLKIDGINGESVDRAHDKWIDVYSFSWGLSNAGSVIGGGGGTGKASFSDLSWMQKVDASTVPIFIGVAKGTHYPKATLDITRDIGHGSPQTFFQMVFEDLSLTSLQLSGASGGDVPLASASLMGSKLTMNYWPQKKDGSLDKVITGSWDLKKATGGFTGDINALTGLFLSGGTITDLADLPLPTAVPEPQSWALLLLGLLAIGWRAAGAAKSAGRAG